MKTSLVLALLTALAAEPAFAVSTFVQPNADQQGADQPSADRPTPRAARPAKPPPRWMVAAAETAPAPRVYPKLAQAPPEGWRPARRWALGVTAGTDGVGVDAQFLATRAIVLRARAAYANVDHSQTYDHVRYGGHLRLSNAGGYVDLHLLDGMLHPLMLSLGAMSAVGGRRHVALNAAPQGPVSFGGHTYTPAQIGRVSGDIGLDKLAPFAGIGFDNTFDTAGPIGFKLLAGVVFSGDPKVSLTSNGGLLSNNPLLQADLKQEEAKVRDAAQVLRYYPAVSTGLTYKF